MSTANALTFADIELHGRLGIDPALLEKARVRRVSDIDARNLLGLNGKPGDYSGIEYPYFDPHTTRRVTSRLRLDHPSLRPDGTPDKKYRQPFGDNRHLYFPPGATPLLTDAVVPIVVVESEKAALAVMSAAHRAGRQVLALGLGGCWSWRGRIGKSTDSNGARVDEEGPLPDFHLVTWADRLTVVLFDARPNGSVYAARRAFAHVLRKWNADVRHAHLPDNDVRVNGPDDYIGLYGDDALWHVVDGARVEDFVRDPKGRIIANNLDNIRAALAQLNTRLAYDEFARIVLIDGSSAEDATVDRLWVQIQDTFQFRPSKDTLRTLITVESQQAAFHPVRRYLNHLRWDGVERLDTWLSIYGGAIDSQYLREVGALVLIAAVRRVRQPGCKFDELLILESDQGLLKSSALRALCASEDWFSDDLPLGVDSKLLIERTGGKWLIEASELHGHRGREVEQLKAFLSRQVDGPVRLAYGRLQTTVPRQFVLIGTTNAKLGYLKDSTGGRRFWPVAVQRFDLVGLERDRDQLWAEAAAREADGASIRLRPELWAAAAEAQEVRRAIDPWETILEPVFHGDVVPVNAVWKVLEIEASHLNNRHADRVAVIAQRFGFARKGRCLFEGQQQRCWLRE